MSMRVNTWEQRFPKFFLYDTPLKLRDYSGALARYSQELCKTIMEENSNLDPCISELKPAVDCIVRSKTQKMGFMLDNIWLCRAEISLMKRKMKKKYGNEAEQSFPKFDAAFYELQNQMKAFV